LRVRNRKDVDVIDVEELDPVHLMRFDKVLFTVAALKETEEMLS
ncbi:MAG: 50S ribosomal protein L4, partial [Pseudomonadales bacterium]|nr:50S ribosomal protein L4 [Pseudomonadales bacterium]